MVPRILTNRRKARLQRRETPLSRRYLRILENWVHVGLEYYQDWPVRPNCGHFLGGCHWYGSDTAGPVLAFAVAASSPEYDARRAGASRKTLRELALKGIRYLCFTHDTGPADCLRPARGLGRPETWGNKWGERGRGFFPESQCGTNIANLAISAMLLGNLVDDQTWRMLAKIHQDYAERFGTMKPKSGVYTDTQMEENGWTSTGLASVECVLGNSSRAATWAATARRWMFCTATTQQDTKNQAIFDGERTVADCTERVFTTLPDYMAENHGMVHPSYTASSVNFLGKVAIVYGMHGRRVPKHALFNRQVVYDQLKLTTDRNGYLHPVQGMDWPYLSPDPGTGLHATASLLLRDAVAARFERQALELMEGRLLSTGGRMHDKAMAETVHGPQDPLIMRESGVSGVAHTYLLHKLHGDGPKPMSLAETDRRLRGTRVFPHSGFVFHRHRAGQTSMAWRNNIMVLPLNRDGINTVAPAYDSFLGTVRIKGKRGSQDLVSVRVDQQQDGFAVAMTMDRAQGSVRQEVLFAGLPSGVSLSAERFTAREAVTVEGAEQGFLRIVNERFDKLRGNCNGYRVLYLPEHKERFEGGVSTDPNDDVVRGYDHPAWVNVDDRLGIVFLGSGGTVYHNRHYFKVWRAVADDLWLSRIEKRFRVKPDDTITELVALLAPGKSHREMDDLSLTVLSTGRRGAGLIADGHRALASFEAKPVSFAFSVSRRDLKHMPIFEGTASVNARAVTYTRSLQAGEAQLHRAILTIETKDTLEVTATEGRVMVRNTGRRQTSVKVNGADTIRLKPKAMEQLT